MKFSFLPNKKIFPDHGPLDAEGEEVLLSFQNVDIAYGKHKIVDNATFNIRRGETFSLVGESGSGKTTIGRAIIRINRCSAGKILYKGVAISGKIDRQTEKQLKRQIQMIFQDPSSSLNDRTTVDYVVSEGLYNFHLFNSEQERRQKVENIIKEVGLLPEHLMRYSHEFSGGQKQRIGIARAMIMEPQLVVADEPISALDVSVRSQVLNLLQKFQRERGTSYLFIAHDLSVVRYISHRIAVIYQGKIVEIAQVEELFNYPLHPYTRSLISAIPIPDPDLEKGKAVLPYQPVVYQITDKPLLQNIGHDHYVYGTEQEVDSYRTIRDKQKNIPVVKFGCDPIAKVSMEGLAIGKDQQDINADSGGIRWLTIGFLFPFISLCFLPLFKKRRWVRRYRSVKRGAIIRLMIKGVVITFFNLALILAHC